MVRIGKGGYLLINVPNDILLLSMEWRPDILYGKVSLFEMTYVCTNNKNDDDHKCRCCKRSELNL